MTVGEGALDGERVRDRDELLSGQGAADQIDEISWQVGDVAEGLVLDLEADAVGAAEQVGVVELALVVACCCGHMDSTGSRWHSLY